MKTNTVRSILLAGLLLALLAAQPALTQAHTVLDATVQPVRVTGYEGTVWGLALGVEASGRVHILWTGQRATDTNFTAFYSTSPDGVVWSPYQILDTGNAFDPQIAVDDTHGRVHLLYRSNQNGIIHRVVTSNVVSGAVQVGAGGGLRSKLAVNPVTGYAYAIWMKWTDTTNTALRPYYAFWNGLSWSTPVEMVNHNRSCVDQQGVAVAAGGGVMLAWMEDCNPSSGGGVIKTAYAADGVHFDPPQQANPIYSWPETDVSVTLAYAAYDGKFHLLTDHLIWPGQSDIYHFVWDGTNWLGPQNVTTGSSPYWSMHEYIGSAAGLPYLYYTWQESGPDVEGIYSRPSIGGTLLSIRDVGYPFLQAGVQLGTYSNFLGQDGVLHLAVGESAYGYKGVYYLRHAPLVLVFVQVLDEAGNPIAGAEVWQNGVLVGTSAANGLLELPVMMGDRLVARKLVKIVPSIRSRHNQDAASNWAYHLYITSLAIPAAGEPAPAIVTDPLVTQTLTLRKDNTLIGFNMVVSVEWDANAEYLENLRQGFELASAALYDASNGQMLFERVTIFDDNQAMGSADYQIRASNTITPYAYISGLTLAPNDYIATGRYFVRSTLSDLGQWDLPGNYRTLLHEFGHYGLYLYDSYFRYVPYTWKKIDADCTSPETRTNQTPEWNATLMDYHYNATEFSTRGVPGAWDPVYCTQTEHYRQTSESDWETIIKKYKSPSPALWTLKTPLDYQQIVTGPNAIPLQEWSHVVLDQDLQTGTCEPAPVIHVVNVDGTPKSQVEVVLHRGNRLIDEGQTDRQGNISLVGAVPGDRATYQKPGSILGAQRIPDADFSLIATQIVSCASGRRSSEATEGSLVTLEPAAFKLEVKISPSANPQQAALQVQASTTLVSEPQASWMQTGASSIVTPTLSYDPLTQAYQGVIPLADGLPSAGELFVKAVDLQEHLVHTSRMVLLAEATPSEDQTIISGDGMAELFIPANSVQGAGQISLQEQPIAGEPPSGLEQISGPYTIQPASGIIQTGPANLTLHYLVDGTSGNKINPNSAQIFSWDGQQWEPVTSTVSLNEQYVSASVEISGTTYALYGRWLQQLYLPMVAKSQSGASQTLENPPVSPDTASSTTMATPVTAIQSQQFSPATPNSCPVFTAPTDGTGIYTIAGLPPTVYSVGVVAARLIYTPTSRMVNLLFNTETQDLPISLHPGRAIA